MVEVIGFSKKQFKKTSCSNCAAKLKYTKSDVFTHHYSACGSKESDPAITCPNCNHVVLVRPY